MQGALYVQKIPSKTNFGGSSRDTLPSDQPKQRTTSQPWLAVGPLAHKAHIENDTSLNLQLMYLNAKEHQRMLSCINVIFVICIPSSYTAIENQISQCSHSQPLKKCNHSIAPTILLTCSQVIQGARPGERKQLHLSVSGHFFSAGLICCSNTACLDEHCWQGKRYCRNAYAKVAVSSPLPPVLKRTTYQFS